MFYQNQDKIKIFTDGANLDSILELAKDDLIDGITTNPTLMKRSGVINYMSFAEAAVKASNSKSISLEVFSDDLDGMIFQARKLAELSSNVYVKIPITNSKGMETTKVIRKLISENISINITAVLTYEQIKHCVDLLDENSKAYISIFAGRIADTGIDPIPFFTYALKLLDNRFKDVELIWASTREVYNIYQASSCGCHIITVTPDIIKKLSLQNYDLKQLSLDTVKMFKKDADSANYTIS